MDSQEKISEESNKVTEALDKLYYYSLNGLPGQKTVYELAKEYIDKYDDIEVASSKFIDNQIMKCTTSGFLTNLGGLITLPISIPVNISSVLYIQLRMIVTLAHMGGLEPSDDEVQTLSYIALTGKASSDILKQMGIKFGTRLTNNMISKISGATLTKINQTVGMRLITKFGSTGIINLGKGVPLIGGFIGGGFDFVTTRTIANVSKDMFIGK